MRKRGKQIVIFMSAAYLEWCLLWGVVSAGFRGVGGIWLDYNKQGTVCCNIMLCILPVILLCHLAVKIRTYLKEKVKILSLIKDLFFALFGLCLGVFLFYHLPDCSSAVVTVIGRFINGFAWFKATIP